MRAQNVGPAFRRDAMLVQSWFLTVDQLRWLQTYHDWIRCDSCHMLSGALPYDYPNRRVIGIAFVRHPIDRFLSSYRFQLSLRRGGAIVRANDLDSFIAKTLVRANNPQWRNGQCFILGGSDSSPALNTIERRVRLLRGGQLKTALAQLATQY